MRINPEALGTVVFSREGLGTTLSRLGEIHTHEARNLFVRITGNWGWHPGREYASMKITPQEKVLLQSLQLPKGAILNGYGDPVWVVVYRYPKNKRLQITVKSSTRPPKRKTFLVRGTPKRLVAVSVKRIKPTKEATHMATKSRKKPVEDDDLDELEGLEDLDDLEDLEDEDVDVDEDEDEDEEEAPAPKRGRKPAAKKPAAKKPARRKAPVEDDEDDDEDFDDDDEDEDEEPAPRRKKAAAKPAAKKAPAKKTAAKKSGGGLAATRELPKGQVGPMDIAELVGGGCDDRYVRIWLRGSDYEKPEGGRWAFTKGEAREIVREIKATRKRAARGDKD